MPRFNCEPAELNHELFVALCRCVTQVEVTITHTDTDAMVFAISLGEHD